MIALGIQYICWPVLGLMDVLLSIVFQMPLCKLIKLTINSYNSKEACPLLVKIINESFLTVCLYYISILALVLTGIYKFCDAVQCNTSFPIQNEQALMFSNYFLSRKSVQTTKGAYFLLNALKTLSNNKVRYSSILIN